jgi:hypothetical protein
MMMKKLLSSLVSILLCAGAHAQTYKVQNLDVLGSFSAPGLVPLASLQTQAANTILANVSASVSGPVAYALSTCNTSNSALQYTGGTGFGCNASIASLAGSTFTGATGLGYANPSFTLNDTAGATRASIIWDASGVPQWGLYNNSAASNNLQLDRYTGGTYTDTPIVVSKSNGNTTFTDGATFNAGATVNNTGVTINPAQSAIENINGTSGSLFFNYPGYGWEESLGTSGSPVTFAGPNIKASRTEQYPSTAVCNSTYNDTECNATIMAYSTGLSGDYMQNTALGGYALGQQTTGTSVDTVGVIGMGRITGSGIGHATGAYFEGRDDVAGAHSVGAEIRSNNLSGTTPPQNDTGGDGQIAIIASCGAGTFPANPCSNGLIVTNAGQAFLEGVVVSNGAATINNYNAASSSTTAYNVQSGYTFTYYFQSPGFNINGTSTPGLVQFNVAYTVSSLPTCNFAARGTLGYVTDANGPTWNGVLSGGGANSVMAFCDGSNWRAH